MADDLQTVRDAVNELRELNAAQMDAAQKCAALGTGSSEQGLRAMCLAMAVDLVTGYNRYSGQGPIREAEYFLEWIKNTSDGATNGR